MIRFNRARTDNPWASRLSEVARDSAAGPIAASAPGVIRAIVVRFMKSRTESPDENRAERAVETPDTSDCMHASSSSRPPGSVPTAESADKDPVAFLRASQAALGPEAYATLREALKEYAAGGSLAATIATVSDLFTSAKTPAATRLLERFGRITAASSRW